MPPSTTSPPGVTAGPVRTRADLTRLRPDLLAGFDAALPGARAAVLARLLGALWREPLPGVVHRGGGRVAVGALAVAVPAGAAAPFAAPAPGLGVAVTGAGAVRVVDDPAVLARLLWPGAAGAGLAAELDNSVANLALARAAAALPGALPDAVPGGDPDAAGRAEQLVVDGHPLHPGCRLRGSMSTADVLAYAPEHRPVLRLRLLAVPPQRWAGAGPPVLPAHPWQAARLLAEYGWLRDVGPSAPVRPLMSVRTVAPVGGGAHLKTAVDAQLTSAVRTVSAAALGNGPRVSALLGRLLAGTALGVLAETGAGAVLVDGVPQRRMAYLRRAAPVVAAGETVVPVAVLAAADAAGVPWVAAVVRAAGAGPYRWLRELAAVLVPAVFAVLARGVAVEAHGQNTLVVLSGGRPVRALYRDLGGVRVSPARLRAAGVPVPELLGDVPCDDPVVLRTKLAGALFGNLAGQVVAALAAGCGAEPARSWAVWAAAVRAVGSADAAAVLAGPLPVKATTAMRLAADPLDDVWAWLPNPLAAA